MTSTTVCPIAVFHSVLGVRSGIHDAADRLRAAGHEVLVVDQYEGRSFDDYQEASEFATVLGYPALMQRAVEAVAHLSDDTVLLGFSNGAGMAASVALSRRVAGVVMLSGALPLELLGGGAWPASASAQIHYTVDDPFRNQVWLDSLVGSIQVTGAPLELFTDYPGSGHLFTDPGLPDEYDPVSADLAFDRIEAFCERAAQMPGVSGR